MPVQKMSSSYRDDNNLNISSGVKAKLQKWIGKASSNVRDKRLGKENSAEIMNCEPVKVEMTSNISPQHSRSRSAPIPMEKVVKKIRKGSESQTSTWYIKEDIERENHINDSYSYKRIPMGKAHSVGLHESSSAPSMVKVERMSVMDCCGKEVSPADQKNGGEEDLIGRTENGCIMNGINSYSCTKKASGSLSTKRPKFNRDRSQTSVDLSDNSRSPDNGRIVSAYSLESIPQNYQQLSGQIQFRLHKWVERASSHLASQRDRRPSEESASSTDDSVYTPDSPSSGVTPRSGKESQVQKIKELELALKELVENVGVRGGNWPSKGSNTNSPGSLSRERSRNNSHRNDSDCQEHGELNGEEKNDLFANNARDISKSNEGRNNSSSDADTAVIKMTDGEKSLFDSRPEDDDVQDLGDIIFIKSRSSTLEQVANTSPRDRRSANLQDVFFSETLIEDNQKNAQETKKNLGPNALGEEKRRERSIEAKEGRSVSRYKTPASGQNETECSWAPYENKLNSKNETERKSERPKIKRQSTGSVGSLLKTESNLAVRESMRQYLKFKDADLSAFAVECVRHANKKKQILREEEVQPDNQSGAERNIAQKKLEITNTAQVADATDQKPIVVFSSPDNNLRTDEQSDLLKQQSASLRSSEEGNVSDKDLTASEDNIFVRTAEEAQQFEKSEATEPLQKRKESLGRTSSDPPVEPIDTTQRLYKFPSMPMFYIPDDDGDTKTCKKQKRLSFTIFGANSSGSNPFYQGKLNSRTKFMSSSNSKLTAVKDENGNDVVGKLKSSPRPKLRQRKVSAPSGSALFPTPSSVRVDIEALI